MGVRHDVTSAHPYSYGGRLRTFPDPNLWGQSWSLRRSIYKPTVFEIAPTYLADRSLGFNHIRSIAMVRNPESNNRNNQMLISQTIANPYMVPGYQPSDQLTPIR